MKKFLWHLKSEKPNYKPGQCNQIIVYGITSQGASFSVCNYCEDGQVYSPVTHRYHDWSECKFTHWVYSEELHQTIIASLHQLRI